ncbi:LysR family transcriptional regulator substrate-binding protein [Paenibacillus sp.]|uniref:LysR family transcriptional regulator substrate-binding protein n=1 Tax=Paenibacillus sp. TaxID=58172 RepID=UPI002D3F58DB|nr:LysR family transcriptional regulator substrate-binding protein [Paenibacillus sp.]HZG86291.1 LysR family transcriptional regulator substrate-binding protein [Paenibacillus sp.]
MTEAGRLFYDHSLHIVKDVERLRTSLADLKAGEAGHVRIGATEPTASFRLPPILKRFADAYPNVRVSVDIGSTPALSERLLKGEIDFALSTAPNLGSGLYFEPWFEEEFAVFLPASHPLARRETIDPSDFAGHRLLVTSETCPYRKKLEIVMQEQGPAALDAMVVGSMTALKAYVEHGLGIALVPKITVAEPEAKGMAVRSIAGSLIHMTCGMTCKESAYPFRHASHTLYTFIKQALGERVGTTESAR